MTESKLFGVLAHPAGHSLSPVMHNTAFRTLNLPHHYHAFDVHPSQLEQAIQGMKSLGFGGCNVTIPHKESIKPYLDEIDTEAQVIGAVNTVVITEEGRLKGYNTDGAGYVQSLVAETQIDLGNAQVLLLGAGGAAKGIAVYLLRQGCPTLTIANRTVQKADALCSQLEQYMGEQHLQARLEAMGWDDMEVAAEQATLIINTTSIGMWPNVSDSPLRMDLIRPGVVISDIVYNPLKTKLLKEAEQKKAIPHYGLGMFVYQGALAFEYFTGHKAPVETMYNAVFEQLKQG